MVDTINQKRVLIVEFKGIRRHSVEKFASETNKALYILFYSVNL